MVAFTNRYCSNLVRLVARKGSGFDPAAPVASTIGATRAMIASDWLEENVSEIAVVRLFTEQEVLMQAHTGDGVDAVFGDGLGFRGWLRRPEDAARGTAQRVSTGSQTRFPVFRFQRRQHYGPP